MRVVAIVAARMNSKRMYGKPMKLIEGKSIIEHVIERLKVSKLIEDIVIATSHKKENSVFIELAKKLKVHYFIGDEEDVLGRYFWCAKGFNAGHIVRVTSENPLIYVDILDDVIRKHINSKSDFTYIDKVPLGCSIEIISFTALKKSYKLGNERHHSELVSLFINENKNLFRILAITPKREVQKSDYRLTVDTEQDLQLMRIIYSKLYTKEKIIKLEDVINFLNKNPYLLKINAGISVGTSRIWK
jgi:spore coat polysaccharide biosynthesis protein SpsF